MELLKKKEKEQGAAALFDRHRPGLFIQSCLACKHALVFGQLLRSSAESSSKCIPFLELSWEDAPMKNCSRACLDQFAFCIFIFLEGNLQHLKY